MADDEYHVLVKDDSLVTLTATNILYEVDPNEHYSMNDIMWLKHYITNPLFPQEMAAQLE